MSDQNHISEDLLFEFADLALSGQALQQVESHLAKCSACSQQLSEIQQLFARIESLEEAILDRDLAPSVLAQLPERSVSGFAAPTFGAPLVLQTAAALVILVISLPTLLQQPAFNQFSEIFLQNGLLLSEFFQALQSFYGNFVAEIRDVYSILGTGAAPMQPVSLDFVYILPLVLSTGLLWLVGNGILLRKMSSRRR